MIPRIYIHTYGRWQDPIATWEALPKMLQDRTTLVVQNREQEKYWHHKGRVWVLPANVKRLSPTRQYIIDNTQHRYICLMDDDIINFGYRREKGDWHLKVATGPEIIEMFIWCGDRLKAGVAHVGISPRNQNHTFEGIIKKAGRMTQMLCYDVKVLRKHNYRFDRVPCMQDFDMTLQLLTDGFCNEILFKGCTNARSTPTKKSRDNKGGCDSYRTAKMQTATAKKLFKLHKPFVKLREKTTGSWNEPVTDVTIAWKKAYESSQT